MKSRGGGLESQFCCSEFRPSKIRNCSGSKITHQFWPLCTPELFNLLDVILVSQMLLGFIITHHLIAYIPSDHLVMVVKGFNVVVANF
jgi:hypothetical protein